MRVNIKYSICYSFIFLLFLLFAFSIIYEFVFLYNDTPHLISSYLINGEMLPLESRIKDDGRFLPLQFFDYNIFLLLFKNYIEVWMSIKIGLMFLLFIFIFLSIKKVDPILMVFYICVLFTFPDFFYYPLHDVSYSEVTQVLFILLFSLFYIKGYKEQKTKYYVIAFLSALYSTYMKEIMFVPYLSIGISQLLFNRKNITKKEKYFSISLILNAIIFLTLYYFIVFRNTVQFYAHPNEKIDKIELIILYSFILFLMKAYNVIVKKEKVDFYDNFLFASIGYSLSIIVLGLPFKFYYVVSLGFFIIYLYSRKENWINYLILFCLIIFNLYNCFDKVMGLHYLRRNTIYFNQYVKGKRIVFVVDNKNEENYSYYYELTSKYLKNHLKKYSIEYVSNDYIKNNLNNIDVVLVFYKIEDKLDHKNLLKLENFNYVISWGFVKVYEVIKGDEGNMLY